MFWAIPDVLLETFSSFSLHILSIYYSPCANTNHVTCPITSCLENDITLHFLFQNLIADSSFLSELSPGLIKCDFNLPFQLYLPLCPSQANRQLLVPSIYFVFQNLCFLAHLPLPDLPIPTVHEPKPQIQFQKNLLHENFPDLSNQKSSLFSLTPASMFLLVLYILLHSILCHVYLYSFPSPFSEHKILEDTDYLHYLSPCYSSTSLLIKVWLLDQ